MTKSYSVDLRERIVAAKARGVGSAAELAHLFNVSKRSVERFCRQQDISGSLSPKQRGGYRPSSLSQHDDLLRGWIAQDNAVTLQEMRTRLGEHGVDIGLTALWQRLDQLGLSFKKTLRAAEQDRPELELARAHWK